MNHRENDNFYWVINALLSFTFFCTINLVLMDAFKAYLPTNSFNTQEKELNAEIVEPNTEVIKNEREWIKLIPLQNEEQRLKELNDNNKHTALMESLKSGFLLHDDRSSNFSRWILEAHKKTQVPIGFIAALIATESSFRYSVVSNAGAIGPAQVRPANWQKFCKMDLNDPQQNVLCGAKALKHLHEGRSCQSDWSCAFAHYNVGRGNLLSNRFPGAAERYLSRIKESLNKMPELWPEGVDLKPYQ